MDEIKQRAREILSTMSLEEKAAQLLQVSYAGLTRVQAEEYARIGVGSFLHVFGEDARHLQEIAVSNKKVPLLFGIDAVHGHCLNRKGTVFPSQLSMACTFDIALVEEAASATAKEVSADGLHWAFSPVLCLGRDIRWGRVGETFGEDKYLAGELGAAMVRGYQGKDCSEKGKILACAKHYIGYGEATGARDSYDAEMTYRKVKSELLPPFERAVEEGCATVMTSQGSISGTPCTVDEKLLKDILRGDVNFDGFVVTDWRIVGSLLFAQRVASTFEEASKLVAESGSDMIMAWPEFAAAAVALVKEGELSEQVLDEAVEHILVVKLKAGLFENPYKEQSSDIIGCVEHQELSKKLSRECVTLLKNDGILPLSKKGMKIAVVGAQAEAVRDMYGDWTYFSHPRPNIDAMPERPYCTLLEGLREVAGEDFEVVYEKGCNMRSEFDGGVEKAVLLAKHSDVVVFAFGDTIYEVGEHKDRAKAELTLSQKKLFEALTETGTPIVSVMIASKPLCISEVDEGSAALLTAFNPGAYGGVALAEVIFGKINPSGKLSISFPYHVGQQPTYYNHLPGWHADSYVDTPKEPLYVFGEGLSYTRFEYTDEFFDEDTLTLRVKVKNVGERTGKETVQVYFRDLVSSVITPVKQLIAFEKIQLEAGEEKEVTFLFSAKDFSLIDRKERRIAEKGEFEVMVGGSSKDEDLRKVRFTIKEDVVF